jgi:hypothetical protein
MVERNGLDDVTGRGQGRLIDVRVAGTMDSPEIGITIRRMSAAALLYPVIP